MSTKVGQMLPSKWRSTSSWRGARAPCGSEPSCSTSAKVLKNERLCRSFRIREVNEFQRTECTNIQISSSCVRSTILLGMVWFNWNDPLILILTDCSLSVLLLLLFFLKLTIAASSCAYCAALSVLAFAILWVWELHTHAVAHTCTFPCCSNSIYTLASG